MLLELIDVPAGPFSMGSDASPDASPKHIVTLNAYRIGRHPVTNAEFRAFVSAGGYREPRFWTAIGRRWLESKRVDAPGFWDDVQFSGDRQPVVGVSWYEAVAFCAWLSAQDNREFLLPSEAEWEQAARGAGDDRSFPWGDRYEAGRANTAEAGLGRTTCAEEFLGGASPFGVLDMAGNVFEWTRSKWGHNWQELEYQYPYRAGDGREEMESSAARVIRGGSWFNSYVEATVCRRSRYLPGSRASNIGFRIVERGSGRSIPRPPAGGGAPDGAMGRR